MSPQQLTFVKPFYGIVSARPCQQKSDRVDAKKKAEADHNEKLQKEAARKLAFMCPHCKVPLPDPIGPIYFPQSAGRIDDCFACLVSINHLLARSKRPPASRKPSSTLNPSTPSSPCRRTRRLAASKRAESTFFVFWPSKNEPSIERSDGDLNEHTCET